MRIDRVIGEKKKSLEKDGEDGKQKTNEEIEIENINVDELIKTNDLLNSFYVRDLEKIIANIRWMGISRW